VEVCPSYEGDTSSSNVKYRSEHSNHKNDRNQSKYNQQFHEINLNLKANFEGKSAKKACGKCVDCSTDCALYKLRNTLLGHRVENMIASFQILSNSLFAIITPFGST